MQRKRTKTERKSKKVKDMYSVARKKHEQREKSLGIFENFDGTYKKKKRK